MYKLIATFALIMFSLHSEKLLAQNFWSQDNCFVVEGSLQGAPSGFLCIDRLENISSESLRVGDKLDAKFNVMDPVGNIQEVRDIPLRVKLIDTIHIGRFTSIKTISIEGQGEQFSLRMKFYKYGAGELPSYPRRTGVLKGKLGEQVIDRYVWQAPIPPRILKK